jgi:hypothetical protein
MENPRYRNPEWNYNGEYQHVKINKNTRKETTAEL